MRDDCFSYNKRTGSIPNVVATNPFTGFDVSLDACIADEVQAFWAAGVQTYGSCCGHGVGPKTIVGELVSQTRLSPRQVVERVRLTSFG